MSKELPSPPKKLKIDMSFNQKTHAFSEELVSFQKQKYSIWNMLLKGIKPHLNYGVFVMKIPYEEFLFYTGYKKLPTINKSCSFEDGTASKHFNSKR